MFLKVWDWELRLTKKRCDNMRSDCVVISPPMLAQFKNAFDPLRSLGLEVVINDGSYPLKEDALADLLNDSIAAVVGLDCVTERVLSACPQLRVIARNGVGLDNVDINAATRHRVLVTAPVGANSRSVAELTIGLILALLRQLLPRHHDMQHGVWKRVQGGELNQRTLGIIGLGHIGKHVAELAQCFGTKVIANDILPDSEFAASRGIRFVSLDDLLRRSDIVSLHVPLTPLTENMMNAQRMAAMKEGALLINTARAKVVDPVALADAIAQGHLTGAAIDVHFDESDESGHAHPALIGNPRIITTPHLGAYTTESLRRTTEMAVNSIVDVLRGNRPEGLANPDVWSKR
jgi:D-3-phosphoglycerate dehydrogenase / 2-oxoglutarate reductase